MKKKASLLPHYYGNNSNRFWGAVRSIKDERLHDAVYRMGYALQTLEHHVLKTLAKAAEKPKRGRYVVEDNQ